MRNLATHLPWCWPKAVGNKLSDSVALVKVKKHAYSWSEMKAKALVERMQCRQKRRSRQLATHS